MTTIPSGPLQVSPVPSLDELAQDPTKAARLAPEVRRTVTLRCAAIIGACAAGDPDTGDDPPVAASTEDQWLTPDEAGKILRKPRAWLIRHHRELPFANQVSRKNILFSRRGLFRWMASRRR